MDIFRAAGVAVITAVLSATVRQTRPELSVEIAIAGGIVVLGMVFYELGGVAAGLKETAESMGVGESFTTVMKIAGIACTAEIAADICRDSGESALASKVELAGRLMMVTAAMPMLFKLVGTLSELAEELP